MHLSAPTGRAGCLHPGLCLWPGVGDPLLCTGAAGRRRGQNGRGGPWVLSEACRWGCTDSTRGRACLRVQGPGRGGTWLSRSTMTWVWEASDVEGWKSSTVVAALLCSSRRKYTGGRSRAVLISACTHAPASAQAAGGWGWACPEAGGATRWAERAPSAEGAGAVTRCAERSWSGAAGRRGARPKTVPPVMGPLGAGWRWLLCG